MFCLPYDCGLAGAVPDGFTRCSGLFAGRLGGGGRLGGAPGLGGGLDFSCVISISVTILL